VTAQQHFIVTNVYDMFQLYINTSVFCCKSAGGLFFLYHLKLFLLPGLYAEERKNILVIFYTIGTSTLILSVLFYKKILAMLWSFITSYQKITSQHSSLNIFFEANLNSYIQFVLNIFVLMVLVFIVTFLFYFLLIKHNSTASFIKKNRKYCLYFCFVLSAVVTPPDLSALLYLGLISFILIEVVNFFAIYSATVLIRQPVKTYKN
jgi:sec-independent protein translocase protein TatC